MVEVGEDLLDHQRILNAGDDPQRPAAGPAGLIGHFPVPDRCAAVCACANRLSCRFVGAKDALEALRSGRCRPPLPPASALAPHRLSWTLPLALFGRGQPSTVLAIRSKHTVALRSHMTRFQRLHSFSYSSTSKQLNARMIWSDTIVCPQLVRFSVSIAPEKSSADS